MKGYVSFLLVLSIVLCIFAFLEPLPSLHAASGSRAIEAERANSVSMNAKEALALSTSYWMHASASAYDLLPEGSQSPAGRELAVKTGILGGWALLSSHNFSDDFEVEFWCGQVSSDTKEGLSAQMLEEGRVLPCETCAPLPSPSCADYIYFEQQSPHGAGTTDRVQLKGGASALAGAGFGTFGAVGASIYSRKFNISNVVYFPTTEWIG
ncbi:hypothetical protein JW721_01065 [Candidatus Micrarchaeota archaeon]|nr:hypothetical protein [Candidatus Micrarchaeota archaeon]